MIKYNALPVMIPIGMHLPIFLSYRISFLNFALAVITVTTGLHQVIAHLQLPGMDRAQIHGLTHPSQMFQRMHVKTVILLTMPGATGG